MKTWSKSDINLLGSYAPSDSAQTHTITRLKEVGLGFDPITVNHDATQALMFDEYEKATREAVAAAFMVGLHVNHPYMRAALAAYSVLGKYPRHPYTSAGDMLQCTVCAGWKRMEKDLTFINRCRWSGGIIGGPTAPVDLWFILQQHNLEPAATPSSSAVQSLIDLLEIIIAADGDEKPIELAKRIRNGLPYKISVEESRGILDAQPMQMEPRRHDGRCGEPMIEALNRAKTST